MNSDGNILWNKVKLKKIMNIGITQPYIVSFPNKIFLAGFKQLLKKSTNKLKKKNSIKWLAQLPT